MPGFRAQVAAIALAHAQDEVRLARAFAVLDDLDVYFSRKEVGTVNPPSGVVPMKPDHTSRTAAVLAAVLTLGLPAGGVAQSSAGNTGQTGPMPHTHAVDSGMPQSGTPRAAPNLDTKGIEARTGLKGEWDAKEGVFTVRMPRTELKVDVAGARVTPPMGLTAWAAFTRVGEDTMVMGDMVVLEDQR
jgi:hypothetical protein